MTSQTGQETTAINILPNISRDKGNQAMKSVQLINYSAINIFFKNYPENEAGTLFPDLFLLFKKALCKVKAGDQHLSFNICW